MRPKMPVFDAIIFEPIFLSEAWEAKLQFKNHAEYDVNCDVHCTSEFKYIRQPVY